uniref:Ubiquitin-like protease family profile domain-containing protein n=1 Tax=Solanum lycopersicum TaxID=4081 RepID=A0A3Q7H7I4_SOLLC
MEEGNKKSLRRSPRIVMVLYLESKVYNRSQKKREVSSSTSMDEVPSFSLGISQISGEQNNEEKNNEEQNKKQKKGKKRVKEGLEKKRPVNDRKTQNCLTKTVILPETRYPLSDSVRHELKSTHKYYRISGSPFALQIWIFECSSKVDEDITICVADSIPRILNWKTIAESPWLKYIEKCLFMPTKNKFENIVANEDEVSKFRLPETPLEENIDLGFNQIKEFVVNSNKQLLEDISLLFAKSGGSNSVIREVKEPTKKHFGETFSGGLDFNEDEDVAGIAVEKVLLEVFETKHPFLYATGGDDESDLIDSFTKWLYMGTKKRGKKPYTDALNVINPAVELGICTHIDVIFYNLRKKVKYETNSNVRFTMIDCVFKTKITNSFFKYCDALEDKKFFNVLDSDDIARYISGRRLLASTSFDKVNFFLIPLNIKENRHWIFVVFYIGERSLEVYDSFPARGGVNLEVKNIVEMLSVVLPCNLIVVKFYDKRPELKATPKYSEINEVEKIKFHFITKGVPKQQEDSL